MLHFSNITKHLGGRTLYKSASFQANPGDKIGLVGPNGAGKSTIFRILVGQMGVDEGAVSMPAKTVVGYFSQDTAEMSGHSVLAEVMAGAGKVAELADKIASMEERLGQEMGEDEMTKLLERYGDAREEFEALGGYEVETRAQTVLTGLGIAAEDHHRPVESFSGGWKMRIALARILTLQPDLLLMDEPTNHLDLESIVWLEEWLKNYPGTLILTSHDREFMNKIVSRIIEVNYGQLTIYGGNYDYYERERDLRAEQTQAAAKRQQDMLAKEEEFIARFKARASHAAQVQSRVKKLEKIERIEVQEEGRAVKFDFPTPPRSGEEVVQVKHVSKAYGEKEVLKDADAVVRRLNKVAVVGVNGAGKSTLLKMLAGHLEPSDGTVNIGASVNLGYFSQNSLDLLNPEKTVFEQVYEEMPTATIGQVRTLLGCFLFSGEDADKKISVLSGGEKSRVVLAMILAKPVNFLVLDEPTNHLDMRSREILMQSLKEFEGTVVLVSHDRHFLKEVSNRVYHIENHKMRVFEGGYQEFLVSAQGDARAR
ncbi:glycosyl transferase family 1 [bacterium SCN 62-11]|nr:ABC-F family ATP-binding cassette domain-containing protein [Candidatus Eremiobacteraeota bacterium]ODT62927.1 MAG: glycosyl transferase family 1 [bacterium SCN 62-11]